MWEEDAMHYGKGDIFVYRMHPAGTVGASAIPESAFAGRDPAILGMRVRVSVRGEAFRPSFVDGDNTLVVATDSMKNFILRHAAMYEGTTMEGFLEFAADRLLSTYPQMDGVAMAAQEVPFEPAAVPVPGGFGSSRLVFSRSRNEFATASVRVERTKAGLEVTARSSGLRGLQLIKVGGNSFSGFVRDEYTTLAEDGNRPLFIYLDIRWKYGPSARPPADPALYVPPEQMRDLACVVFHELETKSIQHLIARIGERALRRFPQLSEVRFESQNRTWDFAAEKIPGSLARVFTEPRPPYGFQGFTVSRRDLAEQEGR